MLTLLDSFRRGVSVSLKDYRKITESYCSSTGKAISEDLSKLGFVGLKGYGG